MITLELHRVVGIKFRGPRRLFENFIYSAFEIGIVCLE